MAKEKTQYLHAIELGKTLQETKPEALHDIGARCKWCQDNLNTWLLTRIYETLRRIERSSGHDKE